MTDMPGTKTLAERWMPDLHRWFEDGIDTPGTTMIQVVASRVHHCDGEGEIVVRPDTRHLPTDRPTATR